jgi:protein-S-isoprenylcysteine O-methyltransferase Ste14
MKFREKEKAQSVIVSLSWIPMFLAFLLPGFDVRLGWSKVATPVVIGAEILVFVGYMMIFFVFRENRFASRVVEVSQGQKVIDTGPYALVRHPMYLGTVIMYVFSPIALGSYWAVIPGVLIIPVLAARLLNEEKVLIRDLPGYAEYMKKVRYHLLPGIW